MKALKGYKQGVQETPEVNELLKRVSKDAFELVSDAREGYPYEYENAASEIEYYSRDGFIASSHNLGGYRIRVFETVQEIEGSGSFPASEHATKEIQRGADLNFRYACDELGIKYTTSKDLTVPDGELTERQREDLFEKAHEMGSEDTIMFEVAVMYHGVNTRGVHSATVQVVVNTEWPYHRSGISWMPGLKCEDFVEYEVTWKNTDRGYEKIMRAVKQGIAKLF